MAETHPCWDATDMHRGVVIQLYGTLLFNYFVTAAEISMRRFTSVESCGKDTYFSSNAIAQTTQRSFLDCSQNCANNDICVAFSSCPSDDGRVLCQLFATKLNGSDSGLSYKPGCKYREKESGEYNPCQNGGTYIGSERNLCQCTIDWTGVFCERLYRDCFEPKTRGRIVTGWLKIQPFNYPDPFNVYCSEGTVYLLRRGRYSTASCPPRFNSSGSLEYFRQSHGNPEDGCDYFLGLDKLRAILVQGVYVMVTFFQYHFPNMTNPYSMQAEYFKFTIEDENSSFLMDHGQYTQTPNPNNRVPGQLFPTYRPRRFCTTDDVSCACAVSKDASWWYGSDCESEFPLTSWPTGDGAGDLKITIDGIVTNLSLATMTIYPYYYN